MSTSSSNSSSAFHSAVHAVTQVFAAPPSAQSVYSDYRKLMLQIEKKANGGELDCPILFEPITTEDTENKKVITVAKFGQNDTIVGISFISAEALIEWFKTRQTHPLTNQPLRFNPLPLRAKYANYLLQHMDLGGTIHLTSAQIQELFPIFLQDCRTFQQKYPLEHAWMQCHLKMGDTGINMTFAGDASAQRTAAMAYLADKPVGTGVFRLSSIESTKLVECFAISYVAVAQKTTTTEDGTVVVIEAAKIRNSAISHVMGYGYTIMEAHSGQKLPEIENGVSNNVPLPKHDTAWASLLDLLIWFHINAANFDLSKMVLRA